MTRLRHSAAGYRRRLQIGTANLVLFTEGKTDRYFYSKLFGGVCTRMGVNCAVPIARELPGNSGGKPALLSYFDFLRRKKSLCSDFTGKRTLFVFLLDKDVDDRCRRTRRSQHIFYTEGYDYENYLFKYGDLVEAGAAAAGLDIMSVASTIPDQRQWVLRAGADWKEWVKICVFAVTRRIRQGGNYGVRPSPINYPPYRGVDQNAFAARLSSLRAASTLKPQSFRRAWRKVSHEVEDLYARDLQDTVFKGKWYAWFLAEDLKRAAGGRDANLDSLEKRIPHHLAMTLDYERPWSFPLRKRLLRLIQSCGL